MITHTQNNKQANPLKEKANAAKFFLARQYFKLISPQKIISVMGNIGKSTTSQAVFEVLSQKYLTFNGASENNSTKKEEFSSNILKIAPKYQKAVLEVALDSKSDLDFYLNMLRSNTFIITRLSRSGLESNQQIGQTVSLYSDFLNNLDEKSFFNSGRNQSFFILNGDDLVIRNLSEKYNFEGIFFGTDPKLCSVWAGNIRTKDFKTIFELNYGVERVEISSKLLGSAQVYPMLAAAALGISLNMQLVTIKKALERVKPLDHKIQAHSGYNDSVILDDSLSDNLITLEESLKTLNEVSARRRILVLGNLDENMQSYSAHEEISEHVYREIAQRIYKDKLDLILLLGKNNEIISDELIKFGFLEERMISNLQISQAVSQLLSLLGRGDVVLVKGNSNSKMDEIVKRITRKRV
jgi:UDP-N-acetylmuramoyl-tripeptide--D-alanyl-D-alanine ligase